MTDDPLFPVLLILRYMHILGAIMLMGGTIFMRFGLAPVVAGLDAKTKADLHERVRSRWSKFVMLASALLLVSGLINLILASQYKFDPVFGLSYNMVVGIKFLLAIPIFVFASFLAGRSATAKKFQANAVTWMNVNLALALVMVLIGGALKFVKREPKRPQNAAVSVPAHTIASQTLSFERPRE
jgi:putative copper export protein